MKGIALALAVMSIGSYYRYGDLGYSNFYHRWEFFHYYLGSKYDRELGYERLYKCAAVAQSDSGQINEVRDAQVARPLRRRAGPAQTALEHPEECRDLFTTERWEVFKADVKLFRGSSNLQYWNDMQKDHGYNPPPVWTVAGHYLASLEPASDGFLKVLACIDPLFLIGMFAAIYWAFGWRVFSVAAIFWGCQLPAEYFWTGGAFMRQDWLFFLCCRRASFASATSRWRAPPSPTRRCCGSFPGSLDGWVVVALTYLWKHKRMKPDHLRVMLGGLVATVLLSW